MDEPNMLEELQSTKPESAVDKLVGEGKKYKSLDDLANAYLHADTHISGLTRDLKSIKEEKQAMREFLDAQFSEQNADDGDNNDPNTPAVVVEEGTPPATPPKVQVEEVDLNTRIKEVLKERTEEERAKANARITEDQMIKEFGTKEDAVAAVRRRADELGVSPQWIADTAFRSPTAFFATMGISVDQKTSKNTPNGTSDVNVRVLANQNPSARPGTKAYYDNIRKTNPAEFKSYKIQSAMMKDAQENPDFFKT